ncbi:hypothetical protein AVEN_231910-2-1, partial [Araneus ventricosus]
FEKEYRGSMKEYEESGHMSPNKDLDSSKIAYFLLHYAVQKKDSIATKLRVVFDGSCKPPNSNSLNSVLGAKSTVALLKPVSIPLLKLNGALLLARLFSVLINSLKDHVINLYDWTDSQVVLSWLLSPPRNWKPFIAKRTSEILDLIPWNRNVFIIVLCAVDLKLTCPKKKKMADLPKDRVIPNRPFSICGIDYAGPISVLKHKGRGAKTTKCYIVVFVCFATKALNLELVSDLTFEAFITALRRFFSRRGKGYSF